jgi:RNA-directed DNA polymerase
MTEMVTSGLMRGCWRRSDGPLEGDTRPKRGETARPRTPCTPPRLRPTLLVAHCKTEEQAQQILESITRRLERCRLEVHPEKTRIVYCKDGDRTGRHPNEGFEFLGYTFRPRRAKNRRGEFFVSFLPAVSNGAAQKMRQEMRRWRIPLRSDKAIDDLARMWNAVLRGWIAYFGRFYKSALYPIFRHFNELLTRWAMRKYKRLRRHRRRAEHWLGGVARREPRLFAHWHLLGVRPAAG